MRVRQRKARCAASSWFGQVDYVLSLVVAGFCSFAGLGSAGGFLAAACSSGVAQRFAAAFFAAAFSSGRHLRPFFVHQFRRFPLLIARATRMVHWTGRSKATDLRQRRYGGEGECPCENCNEQLLHGLVRRQDPLALRSISTPLSGRPKRTRRRYASALGGSSKAVAAGLLVMRYCAV
jgi:hypothetical protein